ncbi:MAG: deoxyribodipyrimidine photolyase [Spirochaetaceae bacterium]|nr:MAG: deoxyribodipyrimidine photolyase [Spirochaetaceae bacterium]
MDLRSPAIWWIKRDLRLADNEAVTAASRHDQALAVYVVELDIWGAPDASALQLNAVRRALSELRVGIRARGGELMVLRGTLPAAFDSLRTQYRFTAIYAEEETGLHWGYQRDQRVRAWARRQGVSLTEFPHAGVIRRLPSRVQRKAIWDGRMSAPCFSAPERLSAAPAVIRAARATELPTFRECGFVKPEFALQRVDESSATRVLSSFLHRRAADYRDGISSPARARQTGSRLSVHLAWGTISLRTVVQATRAHLADIRGDRSEEAKRMRASLRSFERRLHWHDHFCQRLEDEPEMEFRALNAAFRQLPYQDDPALFAAWYEGRTGMPMVDACMRSFQATGFLNFRMRAMLISCACHLLDLSWRRVLYPYARIMADYLPGIHVSQTQMQAGVVGINTIRIYNPAKQLTDHDPDCAFVRRWIPELCDFSAAQIIAHAVGESDDSLGDYPAPVVKYSARSRVARSVLYRTKAGTAAREEAQRVLDLHGSRLRSKK